MTSKRNSRPQSPGSSSRTTESPTLSASRNNDSDVVLMATKLSNVSLVEREERQQALDRLELLKTVSEAHNQARVTCFFTLMRKIFTPT